MAAGKPASPTPWSPLLAVFNTVGAPKMPPSAFQFTENCGTLTLPPSPGTGGGGGGTGGPELAGAGGPNISYSPTYNLYGSATKEDAVEADMPPSYSSYGSLSLSVASVLQGGRSPSRSSGKAGVLGNFAATIYLFPGLRLFAI